jgi:hypothetical protein
VGEAILQLRKCNHYGFIRMSHFLMLLNNQPLPASTESPTASTSDVKPPTDDANSIFEYPLAVKMMFNYDAESNATAILHSMLRETVPAWSRDYDVMQVNFSRHS